MLSDISDTVERIERIILEVTEKINNYILDLDTISIEKDSGSYSKQITKAGHIIEIKWSRNSNSDVILKILNETIILDKNNDLLFRIPIESINKSQSVGSQETIFNKTVKESFIDKIFSKFNRYYKNKIFLKKVIGFISYKFISFFFHKESNGKVLPIEDKGGVFYSYNCQSNLLKPIDNGGILEDILNAEGLKYSTQVSHGFYGEAFAIYLNSYLFNKNKRLISDQTYKNLYTTTLKNLLNPLTRISFDHYEFKLTPILEDIIIDKKLENKFYKINNYIKPLLWREYSPVNVFALRILNLSLYRFITHKANKIHHLICYAVLKLNQKNSGLISDNFSGVQTNNIDLTYHQFSLACLARSLKFKSSNYIKNITMKALKYSRYVISKEGHPSYYGRGMNNIYHIAAYIYAESCDKNIHIENLKKSLLLLENHFYRNNFMTPNLSEDKNNLKYRVGWNHHPSPYYGQSAYFLVGALENLKSTNYYFDTSTIADAKCKDHLFNEHAVIGDPNNISITISRGSDRSYPWSEGGYLTGFGGLSNLSLSGKMILGGNCYSLIDSINMSDLPHTLDSESITLKLLNKNAVIYSNNLINANYCCKNQSTKLTIIYTSIKKSYHHQFSLAFRIDRVQVDQILSERDYILISDGKRFNFKSSKNLSLKESFRNPFGSVFIFNSTWQYRLEINLTLLS